MPTHSIVLITGDHSFAHNIGVWLNAQPDYVLAGFCPSLESATGPCFTVNPTVVLVDLDAPDAAEAVHWEQLVRSLPRAPIISLVTANTPDVARQCATTAGALGCVAKDRGATEFAVNLEAALRRAVGAARERTLRPFTVRQREILLLIADGLTNPAIAQRLVVSEKTVKRHVSTIMEKLGVDNRVQVARWAWEHGLASRRNNS